MSARQNEDDSPSIYVATLETSNFTFQAVGTSEGEARAGIAAATLVHAKQYGLSSNWAEFGARYDVRIVEMMCGAGYRDFERVA